MVTASNELLTSIIIIIAGFWGGKFSQMSQINIAIRENFTRDIASYLSVIYQNDV